MKINNRNQLEKFVYKNVWLINKIEHKKRILYEYIDGTIFTDQFGAWINKNGELIFSLYIFPNKKISKNTFVYTTRIERDSKILEILEINIHALSTQKLITKK